MTRYLRLDPPHKSLVERGMYRVTEDAQKWIDFRRGEVFAVIDPVFSLDGWYFDRLHDVCWEEVGGLAFRWTGALTFLRKLDALNARLLPPDELAAVRLLVDRGPDYACLRPRLREHLLAADLRKVERMSAHVRRMFEKQRREGT